jgi:tRNA pseudouridine13 synthase
LTPSGPPPPPTPPPFETHVLAPKYLTEDVEGVGGAIKQHDSDFLVEELPLYDPCGEGEHLYLMVEKRGMSAMDMTSVLAKHFGVSPRAIGTAGLKDKRAFTRQVVSVHTPGRALEDFPSLDHPRISVLWVDRHTNKLKRGHLRGNRFSIKVRGVSPTSVRQAKGVLDRLAEIGVPNRFGKQRFGYLMTNHLVGRAMLLGKYAEAIDLLLSPSPLAPETQAEPRALYAAGDYARSLEIWPRVYQAERKALNGLVRGMTPDRAIREIDATAASFYISSFQSAVFNAVLNRRISEGTLDRFVEGDLAFLNSRRVSFLIDAADLDDPETAERLTKFEISPSGPMWGSEMPRASGAVDTAELEALAGASMGPEDLMSIEMRNLEMVRGDRRPLRIKLSDPDVEGGVDENGPYIRCAFELPRGSFATTVMDEIMKGDPLADEVKQRMERAQGKDPWRETEGD